MEVLGIDVWRGRWLAASLGDGPHPRFSVWASLAECLAAHPRAAAAAVDIPIGVPAAGHRQADLLVRSAIGPRRSSVFPCPPRAVLETADYREALALARSQFGFGISAQSHALRSRILEADEVRDPRVHEAHPELSFTLLGGAPADHPKRSWNGQMERRRRLAAAGIEVPDQIGGAVGGAPADDVLDAAVLAWTARRIARGAAVALPDPPEEIGGRRVAIWA
jgi:predicted RNase H-like nuclease